jgi:hypothetical protein
MRGSFCLPHTHTHTHTHNSPQANTPAPSQSDTRFTEDQLDEILALITHVFQEEEAAIPAGVEDQELDKIANKLLGASKKKRRVVRRIAA